MVVGISVISGVKTAIFWKAIDEIINIGKLAKIPVQVSHIKLAMHNLWGKSDSLLRLLDDARKME